MPRKLASAIRRESGDGSLETLHKEEILCSDSTAQAGLSVRKSRRNRNRHERSKANAYIDQGWEFAEAEGWAVIPKAKPTFDNVEDYDWEVIDDEEKGDEETSDSEPTPLSETSITVSTMNPAQEILLSSSKSNQPMGVPSSNEKQISCVLEKDGFEGSSYSLPLDGQDEEIHGPTEDSWEQIEIKEWDKERIAHISLAINRQLRAVRNTEEIKLNQLIAWLENEKALRVQTFALLTSL